MSTRKNWWSVIFSRLFKKSSTIQKQKVKRRRLSRLIVEGLEERWNPAQPSLLMDINQNYSPYINWGYTNPSFAPYPEFANIGDWTYFVRNDDDRGSELWKTDGTTANTVLVKDINPGPQGSNPKELVNVGGVLFFVADNGANGYEIWRSEGTEATTQMVKDIGPGLNGGKKPQSLTNVNNNLFFQVDDGVHGNELWKSDGTESGTTIVKDLSPGSPGNTLYSFTEFNGKLFFIGSDSSSTGQELFTSDGTSTGTHLVFDSTPTTGGDTQNLTKFGNNLFFSSYVPSHGNELWKTDGTNNGTSLVKIINPTGGSAPQNLTVMNDTLFFTADDGVNGRELWKSDGTTSGTALVKDLSPSNYYFSNINYLTSANGNLYFISNNHLWKSSGTENSTVQVSDSITINSALFQSGSKLFFSGQANDNGNELWSIDTTNNNLQLIKDIVPGSGSSGPNGFTVNGNKVYFVAGTAQNGLNLWVSDGTSNGTKLLTQLSAKTNDGFPNSKITYATFGNSIYFTANDGINGSSLWKSDGTLQGTSIVKSSTGSPISVISNPIDWNNSLYFIGATGNTNQIWKTDGTQSGTVAIENPTGMVPTAILDSIGSDLLIVGIDQDHGRELWKTNGTTSGTLLVKDANPGDGPSYFGGSIKIGEIIYFSNFDSDQGSELWRTDGTENGTFLVSDIRPGSSGSNPGNFINVNGSLVFTANDGTNGQELWISNGSAAGTTLLKNISPNNGSYPSPLVEFQGKYYFSAKSETNSEGRELWVTDGTSNGTVLFKNIRPIGDSSPYGMTEANGALFFSADAGDGTGTELWKSDGTSSGTVLVKNIKTTAGQNSSYPGHLTNINGTLYFTAKDDTSGNELWISDGAPSGTVRVKDIQPGLAGSYPNSITFFNNYLFFTANDGFHGNELWSQNLLGPSNDANITSKYLTVLDSDSLGKPNYFGLAFNNGSVQISDANFTFNQTSDPITLDPTEKSISVPAVDLDSVNVNGDMGNDIFNVGNLTGLSNISIIIDGGLGTDKLIFSGKLSDYSITFDGNLFTATDIRAGAPNSIIRFKGIETLQFSDISTGLNSPSVTSEGGQSSVSLSQPENVTLVSTVVGSDPDTGSTLTYSISGGSDSTLFKIDPSSGKLSFKSPLQYENKIDSNNDGIYQVSVKVTDNTGLFATQTFSITITQVQPVTQTTDATWSQGTAPATGANVTFSADINSSGIATSNNQTGITLGQLNIVDDSSAGNVSITGNSLVLTNGVLNSGSSAVTTINVASIILGANQTFASGGTTGSSLTINSQIQTDGNVLTISGANPTLFSGSITGSGGFVKDGTGITTLSGNSNFTGITDVKNGLLIICNSGILAGSSVINVLPGGILINNGQITGTTVINLEDGATIGGSGTLGTLVQVNHGVVSPGNSPGILTFTDLSFNPGGGTLSIQITGQNPGVNGYDQVVITNSIDLTNSILDLQPSYSPSLGQTFTIINNQSTNPIIGTFVGLAQGSTVTASGQPFTISYVGGDGNDVVLTATGTAPAIQGQPVNQAVDLGSTATFTATATGNPTPTVQWQVSTNGGNSFQILNGETTSTLTLDSVGFGSSGNQYRAVFTNSVGTTNSQVATLSVGSDLELTGTLDHSNPKIGDILQLTWTMANLSALANSGVAVQVNLPMGLTLLDGSSSNGTTFNSSNGLWSIGNLSSLGTKTLTLHASVDSETAFKDLVSSAQISAANASDPNLGNNTSSLSVMVDQAVNNQPVLLKDIRSGSGGGIFYSNSNYIPVDINGILYFSGDDGAGFDLWKTDGTAGGTKKIKDINPIISFGPNDGPAFLTIINNYVYFRMNDGVHGQELWKSDGTEAGTVLVKDINPGSNGSNIGYLNNVNGKLIFIADDGMHGRELWISDGTDNGTKLVKDIYPGPNSGISGYSSRFNGSIGANFFFVANDGVHGGELWKSNGTESGTVMVKNINFASSGGMEFDNTNVSYLAVVDGNLYFQATGDGSGERSGYYLWKTDGTDAGTQVFHTLNSFSHNYFIKYKSSVIFTDGLKLRSIDSAGNETLIQDLTPELSFGSIRNLAVSNGLLFFTVENGGLNPENLWETDGIPNSATRVTNIDGTPADFSSVSNLVDINSVLYFSAEDAAHGLELWKTDGTVNGTVLAADINPGPGSSLVFGKYNDNGVLYFGAEDGIHGHELWKLDTRHIPVITSDGGANPNSLNNHENVTAVTTVVATDEDSRDIISYSIDGGGDASKFKIDPVSGKLSFISPPQFASPSDSNGDNVYQVTVRATDNTGLFATQNLSVTVTFVAPVSSTTSSTWTAGSGPSNGANVTLSAANGSNGIITANALNGATLGNIAVNDDSTSGDVSITGNSVILTNGITNSGASSNTTIDLSGITLGADQAFVSGGSSSSSLTINSPINTDGNNLTVAGGNPTVFNAGISGSGGFVKDGPAVAILSGASNFTGVTTINQGTLVLSPGASLDGSTVINVGPGTTFVVNGDITGSIVINVSAGAILKGSGTIASSVVINGASFNPGNSPGITTVTDLSFGPLGGTLGMEITGANPGIGGYDQIIITNSVDLTNGTLNAIVSYVSHTLGQTFVLINNQSSNPVVGQFVGIAEGATLSFANNIFSISYVGGDGNDVVLTVTGIPPAVSTQPNSQSYDPGQDAIFVAAAAGISPTPTVQWQVSTNGGGTFTDLAGETNLTLELDGVTLSQSGNLYRAVFTNALGSATTTAAMLTVRSTPSVNWASPAPITYGTALSAAQLNASSLVAGTFTYTPDLGTILHAGAGQTLSVTFTPTDAVHYVPVTTTVVINVDQATLDITAGSLSGIYGMLSALSLDNTSGFASAGLVPGEVINSVVLSTNATNSTTGFYIYRAAPWTISVSGATGTFDPTNYDIHYHSGTLTVSQRGLTIAAAGIDKIYDGTTNATVTLSNNRVTAGLLSDLFTANYGSAFFATDKHVGTNKPVSVSGISISGADAGNYTFNTTALTTANIIKKDITVTIPNATHIYGTPVDLNPTVTPGVYNQRGSAYYSTPVDITNFSTRFSFQTTAYTSTPADGITFVIQNAGLTALGANGEGLGYQGIGNSVAVKIDLINNHGEGTNSTGLYTNGVNPSNASYPSQSLTPKGLDFQTNHIFTVDMTYDGTTLLVQITDTQTRISSFQSYTVNIAGVVGGSTALVGFTGGTGVLASKQNILDWNYKNGSTTVIDYSNGFVSTDAATLALNGNAVLRGGLVLTGSNQAAQPTTGIFSEDLILLYSSLGNTATSNVGSYPIGATLWDGAGWVSDYNVTIVPGTMTVTPKAITYTIPNQTQTYGSPVNLNPTVTPNPFNQAGSVFTMTPIDFSSGFQTNFTFQTTPNTGTVADGLTFTIQRKGAGALGSSGESLGYQGITKSVAIKFDSFNNHGEGRSSTGIITGGANPSTPVSSIDLLAFGIDLSRSDLVSVAINYNATTKDLQLQISQPETTVNGVVIHAFDQTFNIDIADKVLGTSAYFGFTAGTGALISQQSIKTWTLGAGSAFLNYGSGFSGAAGSLILNGSTEISGTSLVLTGATKSVPVPTGVNGENLAVVLASGGNGVNSPIGSYAITGTLVNGTGNDAALSANYTVVVVPGTLTVTKANLVIIANSLTKVYGSTVTVAGTEFMATGLAGTDAISTITLTTTGGLATAGVGNYSIGAWGATGTGLSNYNITYEGGTFTVTKKALTVTPINRSKTYGDNLSFNGTEFNSAGLVNGNTLTGVNLSSSGTRSDADVGTYAITATGGSGSGLDNYNLVYLPGSLTISPKVINYTVANRTKTQGTLANLNDKAPNPFNQAGSVFSSSKVNVAAFTSTFNFQTSVVDKTIADGFTFTIQNSSPTALGVRGGGLGYQGINNSVAIKFDMFSNSGEGNNSTGLYTNGAIPSGTGSSVNLTGSNINFQSLHPFQVNLNYNGTILVVTIKDLVTNLTAVQNYSVDIPAIVGSTNAYVGFTGGTGGLVAKQEVTSWVYNVANVPVIDESSGFLNTAILTFNGSTTVTGQTLAITCAAYGEIINTGVNNETLYVYLTSTGTPVNVGSGIYSIFTALVNGTGKASNYIVNFTNGTLTVT